MIIFISLPSLQRNIAQQCANNDDTNHTDEGGKDWRHFNGSSIKFALDDKDDWFELTLSKTVLLKQQKMTLCETMLKQQKMTP